MAEIIYCITIITMAVYAGYWQRKAANLRALADDLGCRLRFANDIIKAKRVEVVTDKNCPPNAMYMLLNRGAD